MDKALLVGINAYPGQPLNGCVNDVNDMADFLVKKCGFETASVRLLTDARATKAAIVERLNWLMEGLRAGDRALFHYSGHGAQVATRAGSGEVDRLDEVICPVDFDWTEPHMIRDKDFNQMFTKVAKGVEFVWVSDSCHSGDLERALPPKGTPRSSPRCMQPPADLAWRVRTARTLSIKALSFVHAVDGLNVALIAGCKSSQTSADAVFGGRANGALTYFLLKTLQAPKALAKPLETIVASTRSALKTAKYEQEPQLEGSTEIMGKPFLAQPAAARRAGAG
jgi:hypothetical protein